MTLTSPPPAPASPGTPPRRGGLRGTLADLYHETTRFRFDDSSDRKAFAVSGPAVGLELHLGGTVTEGLAIGVQMYSSSARRDDAPLRYEDELDDTPDGGDEHTRVNATSGLDSSSVAFRTGTPRLASAQLAPSRPVS